MSVLMRRENTLIIEPGSDISKIQIINFILLPNSKKHFEGPPLQQRLQLCVFNVGQFLISRQGCGFKCLCAHGFLLSKQTYNCCKKHQTTVLLQIAGCDGFQIQYEANGRTSRNVKTDESALVLNMFQIYSLDTVEARQTPSHAVMLVLSLWRDANRTYVVPTKDSKCA
ncbi:Hypothetical_protein [Hexamita inflata]|uniref:Hypothetical_protein n=1 Tax=Hexamita inflata TaxID=28002 RepID=A0AA86QU21_9EUKA|nr:Hypothetical protein HINF_LOCUS48397 [Hexamita inflata]